MSEGKTQINGSEATKKETGSEGIVQITARPAQTSEETGLRLHQPIAMVLNRPVMPSEMEVAETIMDGGVRPIAVSHLHLAGSFLNGRPIEASSLVVSATLPGNSPIFASDFKFAPGEMLPGGRPIMASAAALMDGSTLPGGRPIAANDTDDAMTLMGFLD